MSEGVREREKDRGNICRGVVWWRERSEELGLVDSIATIISRVTTIFFFVIGYNVAVYASRNPCRDTISQVQYNTFLSRLQNENTNKRNSSHHCICILAFTNYAAEALRTGPGGRWGDCGNGFGGITIPL
jgi:hypothetical protein